MLSSAYISDSQRMALSYGDTHVQYPTGRLKWHNSGVTLNATLNAIIQTLLTSSSCMSRS